MTLDELKAAKARREEQAAAAREAREVEILTLEDELSASLGLRGRAFQIIDVAGEPLIVVKPGAAVLFKRFRDSKMTLDDIQLFVSSCLHQPDKAVFAAVIERRAAALVRCFDALVALYRGEEDETGKRF